MRIASLTQPRRRIYHRASLGYQVEPEKDTWSPSQRPGHSRSAATLSKTAKATAAQLVPAWGVLVEELERGDLQVLMDKGRPIEVRGRGRFKERVDSLEEVSQVSIFYGAGDINRLAAPELARRLSKMNQAGVRFFEDHRQIRPLDVYRTLLSDSKPRLVLKWDEHIASCSTADQVDYVAHLAGVVKTKELGHPGRAQALAQLLDREIITPRQAPTFYLGGRPYENAQGLKLEAPDFEDPEKMRNKLARFEKVTELTPDARLRKMLQTSQADPDRERLRLAQELVQEHPKRAEQLYVQLADIASTQERENLTHLLPSCRDLNEARKLEAHLRATQQDLRSAAKLLEQLGPEDDIRVQAFIDAGAQPDLEWMHQVLSRGQYKERSGAELYRLGRAENTQTREALASLYETTKGPLQPIYDFLQPRGRQKTEDRLGRFQQLTEAFGSGKKVTDCVFAVDRFWPDAPTDKVRALAEFAYEGARQRSDELPELFESLGSMKEPECTLRLYAVTHDLKSAREMVGDLSGWKGIAAEVPLAERAECLSHLMESYGTDRSTLALGDLNFLGSLHQSGADFSESTRLYLGLLEDEGQERARKLFRFTATSPLPKEVVRDCQRLTKRSDTLRAVLATAESAGEPGWNAMHWLAENFPRNHVEEAAAFVTQAMLEQPSPENMRLLENVRLDKLRADTGMRFAETVLRGGLSSEERARFEELNVHGWETSLALWPVVRNWSKADFSAVSRALEPLDAEQAAAVAEALSGRQTEEELADLVQVSAWKGKSFEPWRKLQDSLGQGREMTALHAAILRNAERPDDILEMAETPVGAESTATRALALAELLQGSSGNRVMGMWSDLTQHLQPEDPDLLNYCRLGGILQKHGYPGHEVALELATRKKKGVIYNFERVNGAARAIVAGGEPLGMEALIDRLMATEAEIEFHTDALQIGDYSLPIDDR